MDAWAAELAQNSSMFCEGPHAPPAVPGGFLAGPHSCSRVSLQWWKASWDRLWDCCRVLSSRLTSSFNLACELPESWAVVNTAIVGCYHRQAVCRPLRGQTLRLGVSTLSAVFKAAPLVHSSDCGVDITRYVRLLPKQPQP